MTYYKAIPRDKGSATLCYYYAYRRGKLVDRYFVTKNLKDEPYELKKDNVNLDMTIFYNEIMMKTIITDVKDFRRRDWIIIPLTKDEYKKELFIDGL